MDRGQPSKDLNDIAKTLAGDMAAFATLVDRYKYMVYTLAMRMLRNHEDAEEAAQDTFVKAFHGLKNFSGSSKFSTWIYKIAYNQSLDYLRRSQRQVGFNRVLAGEQSLEIQKPEIFEKLEKDARKKSVKQAINLLEKEDSLVITLYYLEEMNLDDIASVMGMSANTAKVRLHRARKKLASMMEHHKENFIPGEYGYK